MAKRIIRLITAVAETVNGDDAMSLLAAIITKSPWIWPKAVSRISAAAA